MSPSVHRLLGLAAPLALFACSSNYHPEYHPVTVSNFSQNVAYPVAVNNGGGLAERSPVYVLPGPVPTPAAAPPPEAPPPDFW